MLSHNNTRDPSSEEIMPETEIVERREPDERLPMESFYVNRRVYSQLLPSDIHQPHGEVYRG